MEAPKNSQPSDEDAEPWNVRSWVLAPTVVIQGIVPGLPRVLAPGPEFPADVAT